MLIIKVSFYSELLAEIIILLGISSESLSYYHAVSYQEKLLNDNSPINASSETLNKFFIDLGSKYIKMLNYSFVELFTLLMFSGAQLISSSKVLVLHLQVERKKSSKIDPTAREKLLLL